jgi:4-amino-4-deoxy-L-arabinose transferase-like glycosyltransferase
VLLVALLAAALLRDRADRITARLNRMLLAPTPTTFALAAGVAVFVLAALFAQYCFSGQVSTGDEMVQRWHARMLLAGHLAIPAEAHREFFSTAQVLDGAGQWYSQFPIGGPAVIALGMAIHAVWLVNPLLAGLTAWNIYRFAARAFDETSARTTTLLFALSPLVLIMSASEMNHVATLALVTLALAELPRWATSEDPRTLRRSALVIGFSIGAALLVRPMDAAIVAAVVGVFQGAIAMRASARRVSLLWQCAAGAVPLAFLLWANAQTTGHPLLFAYDALNGVAHRPGFHVDPSGVAHTPLRALTITSGYLMKLNRYLFEWPIPGLAVTVAGLFAVRRASRWDVLLVALTAAIVGGYALYWFDGFFAGPRFLYTAVPAFLVFAARMAREVSERITLPIVRRATALVLPLCVAYAWVVPTGVSSVQMRAYYYHVQRAKLKTDIGSQLAQSGLSNALVFVNDGWHARLAARLRLLGARPLDAEQLVSRVDACALQTWLDRSNRLAEVVERAKAAGRADPVPGLPPDERIALVPGSRPTPECLRQVEMDRDGTIPYALFLAHQDVKSGDGGRIGGSVVFARELGERDEVLRARFPDRGWYRYRTPRDLSDSNPVFVPYSSVGAIRLERAPR